MLNARIELRNFKPVQLDIIEKKSGQLPENVRESIQLFNKSLEDIQFGNEDVAIIALKKAISLNPAFYDAMNLLGICYVLTGNEDKAKEAFNMVIEADDSSIKAMEYIKKIEADESTEVNTNISKKRSNKKVVNNNTNKAKKSDGAFLAWLAKGLQSEGNNIYGLKYIAGIIIGVLIVSFIWYMVPTNKSLFIVTKTENIIKDPELEEEILKLNERISKLENELTARKEENLKLMDSFQIYKDWVSRLDQAETEYSAGNYVQGAETITNAQGMTIPDDLNERYNVLWDKIRLKAAEVLYQEGTSIYNSNRNMDENIYKEALEKYENAITFLEEDKVSYLPALYYNAGKAAARANELERAVELFEAIRREFPNSSYSSYAATRLNEIDRGTGISGS